MLTLYFSLVRYLSMQFSDSHAGLIETGLRLRNLTSFIPSSSLIKLPLGHISLSLMNILHPVHPVETVLYKLFQVWKPWDHVAPTQAQMHKETNVTKCFATVEDCTVHLVLPVSLQRCKDLPMHFFSF